MRTTAHKLGRLTKTHKGSLGALGHCREGKENFGKSGKIRGTRNGQKQPSLPPPRLEWKEAACLDEARRPGSSVSSHPSPLRALAWNIHPSRVQC